MNYVDASILMVTHPSFSLIIGTNVILPRLHQLRARCIPLSCALVIGTLLVTYDLEAAPEGTPETTVQIANDVPSSLRETLEKVPVRRSQTRTSSDYLIDPKPYTAELTRSEDGRRLTLSNGLIRRVWRLSPNGACVAFNNLMTSQAMMRSVRPESRLTIDGQQIKVGGLIGQPNHAFLSPEWLERMV